MEGQLFTTKHIFRRSQLNHGLFLFDLLCLIIYCLFSKALISFKFIGLALVFHGLLSIAHHLVSPLVVLEMVRLNLAGILCCFCPRRVLLNLFKFDTPHQFDKRLLLLEDGDLLGLAARCNDLAIFNALLDYVVLSKIKILQGESVLFEL